jgi:hypothetical protein
MELELKYHLLDNLEKREVMDFIDFLLQKHNRKTENNKTDYQKQILSVSVWNNEDLKPFEENNQLFQQWKPTEW